MGEEERARGVDSRVLSFIVIALVEHLVGGNHEDHSKRKQHRPEALHGCDADANHDSSQHQSREDAPSQHTLGAVLGDCSSQTAEGE